MAYGHSAAATAGGYAQAGIAPAARPMVAYATVSKPQTTTAMGEMAVYDMASGTIRAVPQEVEYADFTPGVVSRTDDGAAYGGLIPDRMSRSSTRMIRTQSEANAGRTDAGHYDALHSDERTGRSRAAFFHLEKHCAALLPLRSFLGTRSS